MIELHHLQGDFGLSIDDYVGRRTKSLREASVLYQGAPSVDTN